LRLGIRSQASWQTDLPVCRPTPLPRDNHRPVQLPSCVSPPACLPQDRIAALTIGPKASGSPCLASPVSAWTAVHGYGNINPLSIDYACRPRLRSRLTLGGLACPRNPWSIGGRASHSPFATHACILTHAASTAGSLRCFTRCMTLSYPSTLTCQCRGFGGVLEPRYIVGAESLDQ
jgi:hypothetical protein